MSFTERMLEVKIDGAREKLIGRMKILKGELERNLNALTNNEAFQPNSLGVVQSLGQEIDVLCSRLGALYEMQEVIESDKSKE